MEPQRSKYGGGGGRHRFVGICLPVSPPLASSVLPDCNHVIGDVIDSPHPLSLSPSRLSDIVMMMQNDGQHCSKYDLPASYYPPLGL